MWKESCSVSYILPGIGHPPHRSGCVSMMFFDLLSRSFRMIFFGWCCLSCLWMSFARNSSIRGSVGMLYYMSCSLSNLLFSIVQMGVPSGLCNEVCVGFVGCLWVRSDLLVGYLNFYLLVFLRKWGYPPPHSFWLRLLVVFFSCFVARVAFFACMMLGRPARLHYP